MSDFKKVLNCSVGEIIAYAERNEVEVSSLISNPQQTINLESHFNIDGFLKMLEKLGYLVDVDVRKQMTDISIVKKDNDAWQIDMEYQPVCDYFSLYLMDNKNSLIWDMFYEQYSEDRDNCTFLNAIKKLKNRLESHFLEVKKYLDGLKEIEKDFEKLEEKYGRYLD